MASFNSKKDVITYFPFKLMESEEAMLCAVFDYEVELDIKDIEKRKAEIKELRKVSLFKLILFIPEWFFVRLLFNSKEASFKWKAAKVYWNFFRKKTTLEKFKKDLTKVMNESII
jgi:hypothetical protein